MICDVDEWWSRVDEFKLQYQGIRGYLEGICDPVYSLSRTHWNSVSDSREVLRKKLSTKVVGLSFYFL
jgi:hypothetical protein